MPAVRFSRDKRGYEYIYLVHSSARRGKPARSRVLYWYRTPPGVRIGREPFDHDVRQALERQYPGITFDWERIVSTPMPPPDMTEVWRERRRAERAAKAQRRASEAAPTSDDSGDAEPALEAESEHAELPEVRHAAEVEVDRLGSQDHTVDVQVSEASELLSAPGLNGSTSAEPGVATSDPGIASDQTARRRRRRRGGRRRRGQPGEQVPASNPAADSVGTGVEPGEAASELVETGAEAGLSDEPTDTPAEE